MERHKKNSLKKKIEKDFRKLNDNKTSLQTKRVCENLERIAIDKIKIEKIYQEPGQSNCQLTSTTVIDTTIEESKNKIYVAFKKIFSDIKTEQIHNYYFYQQRNGRHISSQGLAAMSKDNKCQHKWLFDPKYVYCETTKILEFILYGR